MVCVTAPANEAAPTTAYPPGDMGLPLTPSGNHNATASPHSLPRAAPGRREEGLTHKKGS